MNDKKKVWTSILTCGAVLFLASNVLAESTNLVQNGRFEQGLTGWITKGGEVSQEVSHDQGTGSGVLPPSAVNNYYPDNPFADGFVGQTVTVEPNTTYTVTAYAKTDTEGAFANLTVRGADDNVELVSGQKVSGTDWKKYSISFNSGNRTQVVLRIEKYTYDRATVDSNIYLDSVSMTRDKEKVYQEIWRDDFSEKELNLKDWGYELGSIRGIEQQHYVNHRENVFLDKGDLVLKATNRSVEQQYPNPRDASRQVIYNSGSVRTHGKQEFLYGKLEIRAKLPKGQGVFPAFWTLGADFGLDGKIHGAQSHGWPSTGEIDIMELIGQTESGAYGNRTVYQTLHYGETDDNGQYAGHGTAYSLPEGNFNDDYHTFAIDWSKDQMTWLVDGKVVRSVHYGDDPLAAAIINKPQYAQLNLAMGGAWPGPAGQDLAGTEFRIDYISYSQTKEQEKEAQEYYASAPKLIGIKDRTIEQGQVPDLLEGVGTVDGYKVDYSIDTEHTFEDKGGNSAVRLAVAGQENKAEIANLEPGVYNIHYSAIPTSGVTVDSKIARKTAQLTITEMKKIPESSSSESTSSESSKTEPSKKEESSSESSTKPSSSESTKPSTSKVEPTRPSVAVKSQKVEALTMYRLYNPHSGEHFYTSNVSEYHHLVSLGWNDEGVAWLSPTSGSPVYRLYNPNAGDHHYTMNKHEKEELVKLGWKDEGVGFYSASAQTGIPIYRVYNPNATGAGAHHYTQNELEALALEIPGWRYEGLAWYGQ